MKAFLIAVLTMAVLGIGAALVLNGMQETVADAYTTKSVRLGDPGENLVDNWR